MTSYREEKQQAIQKAKVKRILDSQGREFVFKRHTLDEYNQPTEEETEVVTVLGLFHEMTSYLSKSTEDSSTIRRKSSPMILCLLEDISELQNGDFTEYNGQTYFLTELKNVAGMNFAVDLSLEEVQENVTDIIPD